MPPLSTQWKCCALFTQTWERKRWNKVGEKALMRGIFLDLPRTPTASWYEANESYITEQGFLSSLPPATPLNTAVYTTKLHSICYWISPIAISLYFRWKVRGQPGENSELILEAFAQKKFKIVNTCIALVSALFHTHRWSKVFVSSSIYSLPSERQK